MRSWRNPTAWAVAAPLLCAVHCAAGPLLVMAVPALAPAAEAEALLLAVTLVVVGVVLARGYDAHRSLLPPVVAVAGAGFWAASLAGWLLPVPEVATTVAGSVTVAGAVLWNAMLTRRAAAHRCACPACEAPHEQPEHPMPAGR